MLSRYSTHSNNHNKSKIETSMSCVSLIHWTGSCLDESPPRPYLKLSLWFQLRYDSTLSNTYRDSGRCPWFSHEWGTIAVGEISSSRRTGDLFRSKLFGLLLDFLFTLYGGPSSVTDLGFSPRDTNYEVWDVGSGRSWDVSVSQPPNRREESDLLSVH